MLLFISFLKKTLLLQILDMTLFTKTNNYSSLHLRRRLVIIVEILHILLRTAKRKDGLLLVIPRHLLYDHQDFNNASRILILIPNHMHRSQKTTIILILP